jgi:hypothetical protein
MENELDKKIWIVNGMAYHMKEEFVSEDTRIALDNYQEARKSNIPWKIKYYGGLHQDLVRKDYKRAIEIVGKGGAL